MARKTNENSTRQLAFKRLSKMMTANRSEAVETLMKEFNIKKPYANTIYQQHRNEQKKSGNYTAVYVVRDMKENKSTDPYISTSYVLKPGKNDATSVEQAIDQYVENQQSKINQAQAIKLNENNC